MKKTTTMVLDNEVERELKKIGDEIASGWGGNCYDYFIDNKKKEVNFECIEHGEKFVSVITFEDLNNDYGFDFTPKKVSEKNKKLLDEYNSLTPELDRLVKEYNKLFKGCANLPSDYDEDIDDIEYNLNHRKKDITYFKNIINARKNAIDMKKNDMDRFLSYKERKESLEKDLKNLSTIISNSLDNVLKKMGLGDWKGEFCSGEDYDLARYNYLNDTHMISIKHTIVKNCVFEMIDICKYKNKSKFEYDIECPNCSNNDYLKKNDRYYLLMGFLTFMDNVKVFDNWIENEFKSYVNLGKALCKEIESINNFVETTY